MGVGNLEKKIANLGFRFIAVAYCWLHFMFKLMLHEISQLESRGARWILYYCFSSTNFMSNNTFYYESTITESTSTSHVLPIFFSKIYLIAIHTKPSSVVHKTTADMLIPSNTRRCVHWDCLLSSVPHIILAALLKRSCLSKHTNNESSLVMHPVARYCCCCALTSI